MAHQPLEISLSDPSQNQAGFTLIEMLMVVAIIGILAAIAIPAYDNQRVKAYNAAAHSDIKSAKTSLEAYFAENQIYPTS